MSTLIVCARRTGWVHAALALAGILIGAGCVPGTTTGNENDNTVGNDNVVGNTNDNVVDNTNDNVADAFNNTTDPTNRSATYIGADACRACHSDINEQHRVHGHAFKLNRVQGAAPEFPEEGTRAGVPNPPEGFEWDDITYVIGGYTKKGRFIDQDGYILTTGVLGIPTQWNLDFGPNGTTAGFVNYEATRLDPKPYDYSCFVCHTTGAAPQDEDFPEFQENRPGFAGTWEEPGVQCEACHGPGSNHVPNTAARDLFVDVTATACGKCHTRGADPNTIVASGGYIQHHEQWPELLGSGAHAAFDCTTCHDPHRSVTYDRDNALRVQCQTCHAEQSMAGHDGVTFVRGDYTEAVTCESCHMPYATKSGSAATADVAGPLGRIGDTKTHIFRINTEAVDYTQFFADDGASVRKDDENRAAVTLDFVCLRCHNGIGNAFDMTVSTASQIAGGMHD